MFGMLDVWDTECLDVWDLGCLWIGIWYARDVECLGWGCLGWGMFGMCDVSDVGILVVCLGCVMFGMRDIQDIGCLRWEMLGMWDIGYMGYGLDVECSGYEVTAMLNVWDGGGVPHGLFEMLDVWDVRCLMCGMFTMLGI